MKVAPPGDSGAGGSGGHMKLSTQNVKVYQ